MTQIVRDKQLENTLTLLHTLIAENQPFRIVIHQNNDWDNPLPDEVLTKHKDNLTLDMTLEALEQVQYDEGSEFPVFKIMFGDMEYNKEIYPEDVIAIINIADNQPLIINSFNFSKQKTPEPEPEIQDDVYKRPTNKKDWINDCVADGITSEQAERSVNAFMKNNPNLFKG